MGYKVVLLLSIVFLASPAYADCRALRDQELIDHSDLIFEGRPISVNRHWLNTFLANLLFRKKNYYASFEVLNVIKGSNKNIKNVDIYYTFSPNANASPAIRNHPYTIGKDYLVFTNYEDDIYVYSISCSTPALRYDSISHFYENLITLLYEELKYPNKAKLLKNEAKEAP